MKEKIEKHAFDNVWDALEDTPQAAAHMTIRSDLMSGIERLIREANWTQAQAAARCGVSQPRINDLLRGRITKFSIDALVDIAAALDQRVNVSLQARQARAPKKAARAATVKASGR